MLFKTAFIASAVMLGSTSGPAAASSSETDSFETFFTIAESNATTKDGAAYNAALAMSLRTDKVKASLGTCLSDNPGPQDVRGYFSFTTATDYSLVLSPVSPFSKCLQKSLEAQAVPAPPTVPYFNEFRFRILPQA